MLPKRSKRLASKPVRSNTDHEFPTPLGHRLRYQQIVTEGMAEGITMPPPIMTVAEVCEYLRLDRRTVYALLDDGSLESNGRSGKGRPIRIWTVSVFDYVRGKRRAS